MNFLHRNSQGIPKNATFRLTQEGREKLQSYTGTPQARVLVALETCGTSNKDELRRASGLSGGSVERCLVSLTQSGYIQPVGHGSMVSSNLMEGDG